MADGAFYMEREWAEREATERECGRGKNGEDEGKKKESVSKQQVSTAAKISCKTGSEKCQSGNVARRPALADLTGLHRICGPA